jgi:hypothetical protein
VQVSSAQQSAVQHRAVPRHSHALGRVVAPPAVSVSIFSLNQSLLQLTDHCSNQCSLDWKKGLEVTESTDTQSGERFPLY